MGYYIGTLEIVAQSDTVCLGVKSSSTSYLERSLCLMLVESGYMVTLKVHE